MYGVKNPDQIQCRPAGCQTKCTPVLLIHDGGGTTFAYYMLQSLDRDMYAIFDPKYCTAERWEGGMDEIAAYYLRLMKDAALSGPFILGGWSLGGYIAMSMARMIADNPYSAISVIGFLLVDTPYHIPLAQFPQECVEPDQSNLPHLTQKSLARCDELLYSWELPVWDFSLSETRATLVLGEGKYPGSILPGYYVRDTVQGNVTVNKHPPRALGDHPPFVVPRGEQSKKRTTGLPPAVLIRCLHRCRERDSRGFGAQVDLFREDPLLGWASYGHPEFIKLSIDADANHFNLFDLEQIEATTSTMKQGLSAIDSFVIPIS